MGKSTKFFLVKKILLLLIIIILFLFVLELFLRFFEKELIIPITSRYIKNENLIIAYSNRPNYTSNSQVLVDGKVINDFSRWNSISINNQGFRDKEYSYDKSNNTFRILAIGDSITFGYNVALENTWSKKLENKLNNNSNISFEIINMGVGGYSLTQEIEQIRIEYSKYSPDMVIIEYFLNDPHFQEIHTVLDVLSFKELRAREDIMIEEYDLPFKCAFRNNIAKIRFLTEFSFINIFPLYFQKNLFYDGLYIHSYEHSHEDICSWLRVQKGFEKLKKLSQDNDFSILLFVQPALIDYNVHNLEWIHKKVITESLKNNFISIDMYDVYKKVSLNLLLNKNLPEIVHPSEYGHELIANRLFEELSSQGLI